MVADADRACLVLETGVNQRWRYGNYRRSAENTADANAWQAAKVAARYVTASLSLFDMMHRIQFIMYARHVGKKMLVRDFDC